MRLRLFALLGAVAAVLAVVAPASAATTVTYGTLVTDPNHATYEAQHGSKMAMMELSWASYEPGDGVFSSSYAASMKTRLNTLKAAGLQVTLAMGIHYSPSWVGNLPNGHYINQNGATSSDVNVVFNQTIRDRVAAYLARINSDLGLNNFAAIRLTSGGNAEMLYPGGNTYWAYDANAQNGANLPPSMARNPFPGWKPGNRSITTTQVRQWADWYVGGLDNVTDWQIGQFNGLGFTGRYQILTPGSGTRPDGYTNAINNYLPNGVTGVGAVWQTFYAKLPLADQQRSEVYVSSVADHSGNDDVCAAGDPTMSVTDPAMDSWSATRWQARLAAAYGMTVGGENPGYNAPSSFNTYYQDTSSTGMMATATRQAHVCHLSNFYWAHDDRLWDGTIAGGFSTYASYMTANP